MWDEDERRRLGPQAGRDAAHLGDVAVLGVPYGQTVSAASGWCEVAESSWPAPEVPLFVDDDRRRARAPSGAGPGRGASRSGDGPGFAGPRAPWSWERKARESHRPPRRGTSGSVCGRL